ncbi:hypothetical protein PDESU_01479 [Pontiella desulfatans]|uniref:Uncharacterized protein n=1 Tax=Pontiella desulfatans TaxID=2750659 RepID=A0A6C2TZ98_PONDE|nr:hypothetical protein [Pontiella desulfatans]VGO12925.1 hypothetical protein PDESU_01479 [Pontiella desulfatans]
MNNKTIHIKRTRKTSLADALAKGALIWGPAYSLGASTAAYWLTRLLTDAVPAYSDIFIDSLVIFPLWGMVGGAAKWMLINNKANRTKRPRGRRGSMNRFIPRIRPRGMKPSHA